MFPFTRVRFLAHSHIYEVDQRQWLARGQTGPTGRTYLDLKLMLSPPCSEDTPKLEKMGREQGNTHTHTSETHTSGLEVGKRTLLGTRA